MGGCPGGPQATPDLLDNVTSPTPAFPDDGSFGYCESIKCQVTPSSIPVTCLSGDGTTGTGKPPKSPRVVTSSVW